MEERKINCSILTPNGLVYKGDIDFAVLPAFDGEMGFLYNHAPLIAVLGIGEARLSRGQDTDYLILERGFVDINGNELSIFAENAFKKEDLLKEEIEKKIEELDSLKKAARFDESKRSKIGEEISRLKTRLKVASK